MSRQVFQKSLQVIKLSDVGPYHPFHDLTSLRTWLFLLEICYFFHPPIKWSDMGPPTYDWVVCCPALDTKGEPSWALRRKHFAENCCHDTPMTPHGQGSLGQRRFQDDMKASASACFFFHRVEVRGEDGEADENLILLLQMLLVYCET